MKTIQNKVRNSPYGQNTWSPVAPWKPDNEKCGDFYINYQNTFNLQINFPSQSVVTKNYHQNLNEKYNEFIKDYELTGKQNALVLSTLFATSQLIDQNEQRQLYNEISLDWTIEDEVLIVRKSRKGIFYIAIDDEGDVLLSFSGYTEKGWRKFVDQKDFNPNEAALMLLS